MYKKVITTAKVFTVAVLGSVLIFADNSWAMDTQFMMNNDVLFYDESGTCSSGGGIGIGGTLPQETIDYLDSRNIKGLAEQNKARYEHAQSTSGVPWQAIAALHYREAGMNPGSSISNGAPLGSGTNVDGVNVSADANEDAANMAQHFINMAKGVYGTDILAAAPTVDDWGNAFLAYNRGSYYKDNGKGWADSPYVANGIDASHMNMSWVGPPADPALDATPDGNKAGALAIVMYLEGSLGSSAGGDGCAGDNANFSGIIETVKTLARPDEVPDGTISPNDATEAYRTAIVKWNQAQLTESHITDCGRFVSTVMRASGADPEYALVGVSSVLIPYMRDSGKYEELGTLSLDQLQPGDILTTPGHITFYLGDIGDGKYAADASHFDRVPSLRGIGNTQWMLSEGGIVWRLK